MILPLYLSFTLISLGLILTPGPNVLLIVSNSLAHGIRRGLLTVAGTSAAMILQLSIAAAGVASVTLLLAKSFEYLRWAGVAYLVYLGLREWTRSRSNPTPAETQIRKRPSTFWQGFVVSLTNPKTLLFFVAFLPQFVSRGSPVAQQVVILSATFWILSIICDSGYALLASRLRNWLGNPARTRFRQRLTGSLYLSAGLGLAMARRSA